MSDRLREALEQIRAAVGDVKIQSRAIPGCSTSINDVVNLALAYDTTVNKTPGELAKFFHETYEQLAPDFGYETREASRKPWDQVPEQNRKLMTAVCEKVMRLGPFNRREQELADALRSVLESLDVVRANATRPELLRAAKDYVEGRGSCPTA